MKKTLIVAMSIALMASAVQARTRTHAHHHSMPPPPASPWGWWNGDASWAPRYDSMVSGLGHGLGHMLEQSTRPHAWCGWEMRQELGVSDPSYNLAANWAHYGSATSPHVGAIVVWSHHVGRIVGGSPGAWVVHSGNDGGAVRDHVRSVSGAIAFRE
jgi:hypothetical protein